MNDCDFCRGGGLDVCTCDPKDGEYACCACFLLLVGLAGLLGHILGGLT